MMRYAMMIVLVAMLAVSSNPAATAAGGAGAGLPGVGAGNAPLAKTWTTGGAGKRGWLASACCCLTCERCFFSSGGHGIRTRNPLRGTTFPVWPLAIRLPSEAVVLQWVTSCLLEPP